MTKTFKKLAKYLFLFIGIIALLILTLEFYPIADPLPQKDNKKSVILHNIHIVDAINDTILPNQAILIKDNVITKITDSDSLPTNPEYLKIDGKGKYVMPGLWDMHSHLAFHIAPQSIMPLHIANGVMNIRDMQGVVKINKERESWKEQIENGDLLGPRIMMYADGLVGGPYDDENIAQLVEQSSKKDHTFIKVYSYISPDRFTELSQKAKTKGVEFAGHYPDFLNPLETSKAGQKSFEHAYLFLYHSFPESEKFRQYYHYRHQEVEPNPFQKPSAKENLDKLDLDRFNQLADAMAENGTYFCPTHITRRYEAYSDDPDFLADDRLKYIPYFVKTIWEGDAERMQERHKEAGEKQYLLDVHQKGLELTGLAHKRGVKILAGTDSYDPYSFPGFSLHNELRELVKAGLTPAQALQCATITPAEYVGVSNQYGSIDEGKFADIVLLDGNPLEDINNTASISAIFYNGNYYSEEELNSFLAYVRNNNSGWNGLSVSVKIFFRMMMDN